MPFSALVDACVLYPVALRDTLLRFAEAGFYRVLWTERILEEMTRNILENRPDLGAGRLDPTLDAMRQAFPEAMITGYEHLIPVMKNAPKDRHVLAAAVVGRADVLVTANLKDFPSAACESVGVDVQHPDEFLLHLFHLDPDLGIEVLDEQAREKRSPSIKFDELMATLDRSVPQLVAAVREVLASGSA